MHKSPLFISQINRRAVLDICSVVHRKYSVDLNYYSTGPEMTDENSNKALCHMTPLVVCVVLVKSAKVDADLSGAFLISLDCLL